MGGLLPQIFVAAIPFTLLEQSFFSIVAFAIGESLVRLKLRQAIILVDGKTVIL
ncbi:hypothetical protein MUP77_24815 [Candidatus Bathyarchaeota archaeon]|nr:hypothetical protein [Candidatus Bathyarchaeota archaeon]